MIINNNFRETPPVTELSYVFLGRDGRQCGEKEPVLREHHMALYLNGKKREDMVCLPRHLPELTVGHLLAEGLVRSPEMILETTISGDGREAHVTVSEEHDGAFVPVSPIPWRADWLFDLTDRFAEGMPLHEQTWATHSAFLGRAGECLFSCEDIGRHNALDKVVGYAAMNGLNLRECYLYSSGRMPSDMVGKAIRAGIPLLAGKASPTADGVALARKYGLTLVCAARRDRMKLFSGEGMQEGSESRKAE